MPRAWAEAMNGGVGAVCTACAVVATLLVAGRWVTVSIDKAGHVLKCEAQTAAGTTAPCDPVMEAIASRRVLGQSTDKDRTIEAWLSVRDTDRMSSSSSPLLNEELERRLDRLLEEMARERAERAERSDLRGRSMP